MFHLIKGRGKFCWCVRFRYSSGSMELQQVRLLVRFLPKLHGFSIRTCCTRIAVYVALAILLSDSGERMHPKFHHNKCTQHVVSLHGGHVVSSALRSSMVITVKAIVVWNSWSRCYAPHTRENLVPVRIIRRQKATPEDTCTDHQI